MARTADRLIQFDHLLTPPTFDRKIPIVPHPTNFEKITLDLSRVEFAAFYALAQVILLTDWAVRHGMSVEIYFPLRYPTRNEQAVLSSSSSNAQISHPDPADHPSNLDPLRLLQRVRERTNAFQFMEQAGFMSTLQSPHLVDKVQLYLDIEGPDPTFEGLLTTPGLRTDLFHPRTDVTSAPPSSPADSSKWYRTMVPFEWFDASEEALAHRLREATDRFVRIGLARSDARAIARSLLAELVRNVREHSVDDSEDMPLALVGAISEHSGHFVRLKLQHGRLLHEYINWVGQHETNVFQLVVGDSGRGLFGQLGKGFQDYSQIQRRDRADRIQGALWPGSTEVATHHIATGLDRCRQLVASYHGAVLVASGDTEAGWTFQAEKTKRVKVESPPMPFLPGTLVRCIMLPALAPGAPETVNVNMPRSTALGSWVRCEGDAIQGLSEEDIRKISVVQSDRKKACAIVTLPLGYTYDAVVTAFDQASRLAIAGPIALIFLSASWRELDGARTSFHTQLERHAPFLVFDSTGKTRWCGGSDETRHILETLSSDRRVADNNGVSVHAEACGELAAYLLSDKNGGRSLRIDPPTVLGILLNEVESSLKASIESPNECDAVRVGPFRTPTLKIVNRWVDAGGLATAIGTSLAAFVLARRTEAVLGLGGTGCVLLSTAETPDTLVNEFSDALALSEPAGRLPNEVDPRQLEGFPGVRNRRIILFTDLILSGNTARRLLHELAARGARPELVLCVVDARNSHGVFRLHGRDIPVVSLVRCALLAEHGIDAGKAIDIDPVTRQPETEQPVHSGAYPLTPDAFLDWCEVHPGMLHVGHIERPVLGHFSVYANAAAIFSDRASSGLSGTVTDHIVRSLKSPRRRGSSTVSSDPWTQKPVAVWFPDERDGLAEHFAEAVRRALVQLEAQVVDYRNVRRVGNAGRFSYPNRVPPMDPPCCAVVVDWRSLTGTTVLQMTRLAVEAGATEVICLVLLSQLDWEMEGALRGIASLQPGAVTRDCESVPITWLFFTWLGSSRFRPYFCPMCRERALYDRDGPGAPTEILQQHAILASRAYEPRNRAQVFRHEPRDLYNVRLTGRDLTQYVKTRQRLAGALRSTQERAAIITELEILRDTETEEHRSAIQAWLRVVATERHWLQLPPLRFVLARSCLGVIARRVVSGPSAEGHQIGIRRQAVVTLRSCAPELMVEVLPELFLWCLTEPSLIDELLYEVYVYISRQTEVTGSGFAALQNNISRCREILKSPVEVRRRRSAPNVRVERATSYDYTLGILDRSLDLVAGNDTTFHQAWARLKRDYAMPMSTHHFILGEFNRVFNTVKLVDEHPRAAQQSQSDSSWSDTLSAWQNCEEFLTRRVLLYLHAIENVLLSRHNTELMPPHQEQWLREVVRDPIGRLGRVGNVLVQFANPTGATPDQGLVEGCFAELRHWGECFMNEPIRRSPNTVGGGGRPALLYIALDRCPCDLSEVLELARDRVFQRWSRFRLNIDQSCKELPEVFCDREVLAAAVEQLILNVKKHSVSVATETHRIDVDAKRRDDRQVVKVRFRNDLTRASREPGRGHRSIQESLHPFGGSVSGRVEETQYSYEASLTLSVT